MNDPHKTPEQLIAELTELRRRCGELEVELARCRQTEGELRQSADRYQTLVDACPDAVLVTDPAGCVHFASRQMWTLLGWPESEELVGQSAFDFVIEEQRSQLSAYIADLLQHGTRKNTEFTARRRDGNSVATEISSIVIRNLAQAPTEIVTVVRDIRDRQVTQAALAQSYDALKAIYDGMVDGLHILNLQTMRVVRANAALCRMMGYSEQELLTLSQADVHPAEDLPWIARNFAANIQRDICEDSAVPLVRKDGTVFYADIIGRKILYEGTPCLICFFRDTTERRKAQEAMQQERSNLMRMLQASDHERRIISCEIHDGLAQYLGSAWMQFQVFRAQRKHSAREAWKAFKTALALVRQAHSEARRLISAVRPPVIDEMGVQTAIAYLVHEHQRRGGPKIRFRADVQFGRLLPVLENALYRIAQEALTNACRHSQSKRIQVTLTQVDEEVQLEIRDWGIGFDRQQVAEGHFGLISIEQRVRLLGGRLSIDSVPDSGTSIRVVVPIVKAQDETA